MRDRMRRSLSKRRWCTRRGSVGNRMTKGWPGASADCPPLRLCQCLTRCRRPIQSICSEQTSTLSLIMVLRVRIYFRRSLGWMSYPRGATRRGQVHPNGGERARSAPDRIRPDTEDVGWPDQHGRGGYNKCVLDVRPTVFVGTTPSRVRKRLQRKAPSTMRISVCTTSSYGCE
jgi:hypothetical protein